MEEQWKDIYGYEGLYQVSNLGRVRSLPRNGTVNDIKILKQKRDNGYLRISLKKNGFLKTFSVHRLVAQAFLPNDDLFKTQINHKDENKENNNVKNLEWCDAAYNNNYGTHQQRSAKSRLNHPNMSKQVNQYSLDGNFIRSFQSTKEIQRQLGFSQGHIIKCCNGGYFDKRRNKFVNITQCNGFIWKYKNDDE